MIDEAKNKMVNEPPIMKSEPAAIEQEFHFGGSGQFQPMAVLAHSIEEATDIWKKERKLIKQLIEDERK